MHVLFFQRATLALILKYNTDRGWWLLVEMMTKCFSCISITIADTGGKQMQILAGVFLFYGTMLANSFPYRFARHMYSDTAFTICKVMVLCMAVSCIAGDSTDGTPILFVVCVAYSNTCVVVVHSFFSFLKGKAADPQWDRDFAIAMLRMVQKMFRVPKQHSITELVPGLDSSSARWSTSDIPALNAKVVELENSIQAIKTVLESKSANSNEDNTFVSTNFVPDPKKDTFSTFAANHEKMTVEFRNKTIGDPSQKMEEQSNIIQELLRA